MCIICVLWFYVVDDSISGYIDLFKLDDCGIVFDLVIVGSIVDGYKKLFVCYIYYMLDVWIEMGLWCKYFDEYVFEDEDWKFY